MMVIDIIILFIAVAFLGVMVYLAYQTKENMTYVHPKSGGKYKVISTNSRYKDPKTREWSDTVTYCSLKDGRMYAREKNDFYSSMVNIRKWKKQKEENKER